MSFDAGKVHKLQDRLESEAYDWMEYRIQEQYNVKDMSELTEEQIEEIEEYIDGEDCHEPYVRMALRSICDNWNDEHHDGS